MTAPPDLPVALIDRIEGLRSPTVVTLRTTVYEVLHHFGVDVETLARDARMEEVDRLQDEAERAAELARTLKGRVQAGTLPAAKLATALERLRALGRKDKAYREQLRRIEARPPPLPPSAPTRELVRHMGQEPVVRDREPGGQPLSAPRYEFQWSVDRMAVSLTAEEYQAAQRLREAFARRQSTPKAVDWSGGSGRAAPGSRTPVTDAQMRASADYNAIWTRLDPTLRMIVANFLFEQAPRGRDRTMTPLEFGQLYGEVKDKATARGVTLGAVKTTCAVIALHFRGYDQWRAEKAREEKHQVRGPAIR